MLYWICPECGYECSPAVRECPGCAAAAEAAATAAQQACVRGEAEVQANVERDALSAGILALVQEFQTVPAKRLLMAGSQPNVEISINGHTSEQASTCVLEEEPPPVEESAGPADSSLAAAVELVEADGPAEPSTPLVTPNFLDTSALAQALEQEARVVFEAVTPRPSRQENRDEVCQALESEAQLVLESIEEKLEAEQTGIRAIVASFSEAPATSLLGEPLEVLKTPAPAALEWMRTPRPTIPAASPQDPNLAPITDGPLTPTLNGPCLPPQLHRFTDSGNSQPAQSRKRKGLPGWLISFLVATILILGSARLLPYLTATRDTSASGGASQQTAETASSGATAAVLEEHPLARFVEVAGVRVTSGVNHKLQLEYIVVNHSARELTGLGIRLALRSGEDASNSAAPLFTVFSKLSSLGPYQSREIRTEIDPPQHSAASTDWQSVRAETLIAKAQ